MNIISVNKTPENTICYPLHRHNYWEIMYYTRGDGFLKTASGNIPFSKNTVIIVPPFTVHGSVSDNEFTNISIGGNFENHFMFQTPVIIYDNEYFEGKNLAELIFKNRYSDNTYLSALGTAYITFLLLNIKFENNINRTISKIVSAIEENYHNPAFRVTTLLQKSGYAEDYIRAYFKKITGHTPVNFITKLRIEYAERMLQIYGKNITVSQVAIKSGFTDTVYFSKRFKQFTEFSPEEYRKHCSFTD